MESQNAKINEIEKALEDSNKLLQDNAMLEILRGSEWNEAKNALEVTVSEQSQKINMLSVEII